tara:strand:+ start:572 stop:805 length:234 start_codon:yes stop_codon:yes gene_type:complete
MEDLMQYTANELKKIIREQLPNLRNFNKKRKELLVDIITSNDLDISSLKPVQKKEVEEPKFTMRFGKFSPFANDLND